MINQQEFQTTILLAEDSEDDAEIIKSMIEDEVKISNEVVWLKDGADLMNFLHGKGPYDSRGEEEGRFLILLDLNMPKKNGIEFLKELHDDPELSRIPVIVFTTSQSPSDVADAYNYGAYSFIVKPFEYKNLVEIFSSIKEYWLNLVTIPKVTLRKKSNKKSVFLAKN